jgi:general secretion pathway protein D
MVATFRAFKKDKYSKLLQGPHISVLDNTEATIFVGEQVPYAEARATANQFGGLEFTISEGARSPVRVGFQLLVIPRIVPESNKVILTIIPINEFLSGSGTGQGLVPGFERFTIPGAGQNGATVSIDLPRIASTTLVTRLMLESGRTAVIGGLVNERVSYEDKKVPFLGDLPVVGYFFKSRADNIKREHLLIFVTPRIIRSVTQQEESLKALLKDDAERARKEYEAARKAAEVDRLKKEDAERAKEKAGEVPK